MSSVDYKYKPDKHQFRVSIKTIDELHKENVETFKKSYESLPVKKRKLLKLKKRLEKVNTGVNDVPVNLDVEQLRKRRKIKEEITQLENEVKKSENFTDEMDYYSRTGPVIYDYYNLTNGMLYNNSYGNINKDDTPDNLDIQDVDVERVQVSQKLRKITKESKTRKLKKPVKRRSKKENIVKGKGIMGYLLGSDEEDNNNDDAPCRASLQDEYLIMMDKEYACSKARVNIIKECEKCKIDMIIVYSESIITCPQCGEFEEIFIESEVPSNRETFNEKPKYPYKRRGHCIEKLNQFLCKGIANVPDNVFDIMENEIKKYDLVKSDVTLRFVEKMLKKHGLSKYYEQSMYIFNKLTGTKPKVISREQYELILRMFDQANELYEAKYKPNDRENFMKYTFALNKIFLTIGLKKHAKYFKLLKGDDKTKKQEKIWKFICMDMGWKYHPS